MTNKCKRGILISKTPYETRYAIMEDGELAELVVDGASSNPIRTPPFHARPTMMMMPVRKLP